MNAHHKHFRKRQLWWWHFQPCLMCWLWWWRQMDCTQAAKLQYHSSIVLCCEWLVWEVHTPQLQKRHQNQIWNSIMKTRSIQASHYKSNKIQPVWSIRGHTIPWWFWQMKCVDRWVCLCHWILAASYIGIILSSTSCYLIVTKSSVTLHKRLTLGWWDDVWGRAVVQRCGVHSHSCLSINDHTLEGIVALEVTISSGHRSKDILRRK